MSCDRNCSGAVQGPRDFVSSECSQSTVPFVSIFVSQLACIAVVFSQWHLRSAKPLNRLSLN
jgi:hypothetical protein